MGMVGGGERKGESIVYTKEAFAERGECPADRELLGNHTWTFLHSVAAYYPEVPTTEDETRARNLVDAVAHMYPCSHCAYAFQKDMGDNPPRVASRREFSMWMCEMHNRVNAQLDKPTFPCNIHVLDARWRNGARSCWDSETE